MPIDFEGDTVHKRNIYYLSLCLYLSVVLFFLKNLHNSSFYYLGIIKVHASLKRKRTDSDSENTLDISEKKKKEICCCEIELLKNIRLNLVKLRTAAGTDREQLFTENRELRETLKLFQDIQANVLNAEQDRSITITLKFLSVDHLNAFMMNLNKLEECLMDDLRQLPGCQKYDLTDTYIEVTVSEDLYEEVKTNLKESK